MDASEMLALNEDSKVDASIANCLGAVHFWQHFKLSNLKVSYKLL